MSLKSVVKLRFVAAVAVAMLIAVPAVALAATQTSSSGTTKATLTYKHAGGSGSDARLKISRAGKIVYNKPVSAKLCGRKCGIYGRSVFVRDLYGNGSGNVVLKLQTGSNYSSEVEVFAYSSAVGSYVITQRNFGSYGARLQRIGAHHRWGFISGDNAFYCRFSDCAQAGLPIQIFTFTEERFKNVTRSYPRPIRKNAAMWWKDYRDFQGLRSLAEGPVAAWTADEYNLGRQAKADKTLAAQVSAKKLPIGSAVRIEKFLKHHGY